MALTDQRTERHQPWLERFCHLALAFAACVLLAGGETTSNQAGMAFQTWPLSNGSLNPAGWLSNLHMFLEHSHRLLAGTTTILTLIAAIWVQATEARRWVRRLGWILMATIFIQALLGGARVLFDQTNLHLDSNVVAQSFAVCHALVAEATVCLWVTLTVALSRGWMVRGVGARLVAPGVRRWGHVACAAIFLQIFIGAVMRHGGYALVIPTFPWSTLDGALLPTAWSWPVTVNFAHRVGAGVVTVAILALAASVFRDESARRQLGSWMTMILLVLATQIGLGAEVIWSNKNPNVATAHLLTGAFLLASTWLLTFVSYRSKWWPPDAAENRVLPASPTLLPSASR
jgi:cytochrome c oxidase assembly protein subunit 15